ncbi:MAG: hypothetical protein LBC68_03860 [Prevotellaceae bacterium]|nr:hypothetical protein [Prevotellaceae bacterium]
MNGNNIDKPYLNGQKVNAYLGGQKIWNDGASPFYYNGWQHDMPEPDWNALNNTIPSACQLFRDIYGYWYHNNSYSGTTYTKRSSNLVQIGNTLTNGNKVGNRNSPYVITNYLGSGRDVVVFPAYNQFTDPTIIYLDNFTADTTYSSGTSVVIPAGQFTDAMGTQNASIAKYYLGCYFSGSSVFVNGTNNCIVLFFINGFILANNQMNNFYSGKFGANWMDGISSQYHCAGNGYYIMLNFASGIAYLFNWQQLLQNGFNLGSAFIRSFSIHVAGGNMGYDCYYIYNGNLIICDFQGNIRAYSLPSGTLSVSTSDSGMDQSCFFWRNKIYRTGTRVVTTLNL